MVGGTKMSKIDNCERSEEMRGAVSWGSVPENNLLRHSSYRGVVNLYDDVVISIQGVEPCLETSVQSHGMR